MKIKHLVLIGVLLVLAVVLSGCATGLTASSWPSVLADEQLAYVAGGPYVYALNLQTGAQVWRFPEKGNPANPFYATPALTSDGQLIVGGFDKKLYGLNPQTGSQNWVFTGARDRWIGGPLVAGDTIYAANADYNLYALDLKGALKWTFGADQSIWGTPVSDGTNLYFGTLGRKIYAVNAQTGKQVWVTPVDGAVISSLVFGPSENLYVGTFGGSLYTISTSGRILNQETTSSQIWSAPAVDDTSVLFGNIDGILYSFSSDSNGQSWNQQLNGAVLGTPLVSGDNIVIGTEAGNLYFISRDGQKVTPVVIPGKLYSSPVAAGDLVLVAQTGVDSILVALDASGAQKWSFTPAK